MQTHRMQRTTTILTADTQPCIRPGSVNRRTGVKCGCVAQGQSPCVQHSCLWWQRRWRLPLDLYEVQSVLYESVEIARPDIARPYCKQWRI